MTTAALARLLAIRRDIRSRPRFRWLALVVVASGMMLSVVNVSIVNIALPSMAADLGVDVPSIGWVVTGFLVTQATLLPIAGRAGDLYGRRRIFVAGVLVLIAGSLLCGLAWNAPSLIAFRILQGIGASAMAPTAFSYAAELFGPHERGQALGIMGGVIGLAPVLALNLAGGLVAAGGWRTVFWFTPIMGVFVLAGAVLVLPESRRTAARRFDLPGAALAALGLFALLVALSRGGSWGWAAPATVAAAATGVAALAAFVVRESRTADPLLDLRLLRMRSLATANLAAMTSAAALFGTLVLLPFYLTAVLGYDAVAMGLAITPIAASFVLVAPLAGRAMGYVGSARMAAAGFGVATAGALWMAVAAPGQDYARILPGVIGLGVGLAMATAPITTTAISEAPPERLGVASALPNISRYTGGALGVAILGAIMHAAIPAGLDDARTAVGAAGRAAVADGLRVSMLVAAGFLSLAAVAASAMPPVRARRGASVARPVGTILPGPRS